MMCKKRGGSPTKSLAQTHIHEHASMTTHKKDIVIPRMGHLIEYNTRSTFHYVTLCYRENVQNELKQL